MRKMRRKNRQTRVIVSSLVGCLLLMGIGYSVLTTNLNFQVKANKNAPDKLMDVIREKNVIGNQEGLVTDGTSDRNIRYAGNDQVVKNYLKFNNEVWRIMGIIDGNIKIVRNESIGQKRYDARTEEGINDWGTSDLATYLNGTYYQSLNSAARNMVLETTYYLGNLKYSNTSTVSQFYEAERGDMVYKDCVVGTAGETSETCPRKATWVGKIGLIYLSDYGYAAGSECTENILMNYKTSECKNNNWLFHGARYWTLMSFLGNFGMYIIETDGSWGVQRYVLLDVYPTIYLKSSVEVTLGDGTLTSPYEIALPS